MQSNQITIRDLARLIGKLVSSFHGTAYGPLFHRDLEMAKTEALKLKRGNYDATMVLSDDTRTELQWWVDNLETATSLISNGHPYIVIDTDALLLAGGLFVMQLQQRVVLHHQMSTMLKEILMWLNF